MPTISRYKTESYGYQYTSTLSDYPYIAHKKKNGIKYYLKCIKWLWNNREWANTRQKFKAMDKECNL